MTTRRPVSLLAVCCLLAVPLSAAAQMPDSSPPDEARMHLGPLALAPRIALRNLGVDTNVLNADASPERDLTASLTPEVRSWLRIGRLDLSGTSSVDWNYYQRLTAQRSFNGAQDGRAELGLGYLRPYLAASIARSRQRPNLEIDARVERTTRQAGGGIVVVLGPRLTVDLGHMTRRLAFGDERLGDIAIADVLDRRESEATIAGRFALTPLTSVVADVGYRQDRFREADERNASSVAVQGGFEFKPLALISGRARVGWRQFTPENAALPRFRGAIADVEVGYLIRDLTRVTVHVARELEYSFEPAEPYYVSTGTQVDLTQIVGRGWDVVGRVGRTSMAYTALRDGARADAGRVDRVLLAGGGVGKRLGSDVRVGVDVDRVTRRSDVPGRTYEGVRVGGSVTYGF